MMLDAKQYSAAIDAARSENEHGIQMRAGKKYTSVAVRVEIARRYLGNIGIETEFVHMGMSTGEPVVIRAKVTDETSRVIGCGTAQEIIGQGNVNRTSAIENAETSAIGRAMASLGLSGGEFASANEMDGVERKEGAKKDAAQKPPTPEGTNHDDGIDRMIAGFEKARTQKQLKTFRQRKDVVDAYKNASKPRQLQADRAYSDKWNSLPDDPALQDSAA